MEGTARTVNVLNRTDPLPDLAADIALRFRARVSGREIASRLASLRPVVGYAFGLGDRIARMAALMPLNCVEATLLTNGRAGNSLKAS